MTCSTCNAELDKLEAFPGDVCLPCWAVTPQGRHLPTSSELVAMWGG